MADIMRALSRPESNPNIPPLRPGDTVRVHNRIVEGERERVQTFQGVVIGLHGGGADATFTVRRIAAHGVGVERTFAFHSPRLEKVEVLRHGQVRRAKLYYLRGRRGKAARLRERRQPAPTSAAQASPEPAAE
ncbi:MAG: 50S ribosomal protein L19 [Anaerolineae bacterium]|nr:50S ribosomal protein L19 [Anaerolineae bacterium]